MFTNKKVRFFAVMLSLIYLVWLSNLSGISVAYTTGGGFPSLHFLLLAVTAQGVVFFEGLKLFFTVLLPKIKRKK